MLCEHFGRCGGCTYLDIPYNEELTEKRRALAETMGDFADCIGEVRPAPPCGGQLRGHTVQADEPSRSHIAGNELNSASALQAPVGYRNKMEFAFGDEGANSLLAVGIRKKRSFYEVATPYNCILVPEDFKKIAEKTVSFFREKNETFFHRKKHTGALRHLVLRRGENTGEILVLLSTASALQANLDEFVAELLAIDLDGEIVGIMRAINDGVADAVKSENVEILHGRDYYYDELQFSPEVSSQPCSETGSQVARRLRFKISQFSFFQTNTKGAEALYSIVREFASEGNSQRSMDASQAQIFAEAQEPSDIPLQKKPHLALDLYCGTGTIAQIIAPDFEKVIGVEIIEEAVVAAKENATANGITNCEFFAGDAFEVLQALPYANGNSSNASSCRDASKPHSDVACNFSTIIVDPPRDGLSPKALAHIVALGAPRVVYVACKPKSLARDLPTFIDAGYALEKIEAVDMFPRTPHLECVALLRRG